MISNTDSAFASYYLTPEEELTGNSLTLTQTYVIQNQLALLAQQRIALVPDPNNYPAFIQQEAHIKGQMTALQYLLDASVAAGQAVLNLAVEQAASQSS